MLNLKEMCANYVGGSGAIVVFNGKNVLNIAAEAAREFGGGHILLIKRNNDNLDVKHESIYTAVLTVDEFITAEMPNSLIMVCNGGTTAQLVPVIKQVLKNKIHCCFVELPKEGGVINY